MPNNNKKLDYSSKKIEKTQVSEENTTVDSKIEKALKVSSDELIAAAIRDVLKRDESIPYH